MSTRKKQSRFTLCSAFLVLEAEKLGYELTDGDAYRDERCHGKYGEKKSYGHKNSLHKLRLAKDYNLFVNDAWVTDNNHPAWRELHDFWENKCGGATMIEGDACHFSFEHRGMR